MSHSTPSPTNPPSTHSPEAAESIAGSDPHRRVQEQKRTIFGLQTDPFIFFTSAGFVVAFVALTIIFGEKARDAYAAVSGLLMDNLSWLYIGGYSAMLVFLIVIFISKFGNLRLGDDDEDPIYSTPVWFAMLFAAGLGATLLFWGAAEPLHHAFNPPRGDLEPMSNEAITQAFNFTYYHFAAHMWVPFIVPGLAMGYFTFKRKMPARMSSAFSPVLGGYVYKWPGKLIDALSIIGTIFGLAVSVGLGVLQINAGLNILWGVPLVGWVEVCIIALITAVATASAVSGLDKGIKTLSNINIYATVVLAVFVLVMGPTLTILKHSTEAFGQYASSLPEMMFWTDSFDENPGWHETWTAFYWAWTICWSPFVGMFIARISRGRTVRQFIGGVLLLPTTFVVLWFSIFGRAAIEVERNEPGKLTKPVVEDGDTPVALFALLSEYPLYMLSGALAIFVIVIYFITSIDSAAIVMDTFASGEEAKTPAIYRASWAISVGVVTGALLFINESGIEAIQQVVIIVALPFFFMMFLLMYSITKGMSDDYAAERRLRTREWEKTDTPEKLEAAEAKPAPGYNAEGDPIDYDEPEYDEEGRMILKSDVRIEGDLDVGGEDRRD